MFVCHYYWEGVYLYLEGVNPWSWLTFLFGSETVEPVNGERGYLIEDSIRKHGIMGPLDIRHMWSSWAARSSGFHQLWRYGSLEEKDIVSKWAGHYFKWTEISRAKHRSIVWFLSNIKENWVNCDESSTSKNKRRKWKGYLNPSRIIAWKFFWTVCSHWILWFSRFPRCFSRFKFLMQLAPVPKASIDFLAGIGAGFAEAGLLWGAMMFATQKMVWRGCW